MRIYNGVLLSGTLGKNLLGVGTGTLLHLVVQQLGEDRARNFLDNLHDVSLTWIQHKGFTFSLRDISIPDKQRKAFHAIIDEAERNVADYLKQVTNANRELTVDATRVESTINQKLNQTISKAGKDVLPSLPRSNLSDMATGSESKGKKSNITQMVGYVGQQNVYGIPYPVRIYWKNVATFPSKRLRTTQSRMGPPKLRRRITATRILYACGWWT